MGRLITSTSILFMCSILAACAHSGSQVSAGSPRYTLAVLPWQVVQEWDSGDDTFDVTMRGFQGVIAHSVFKPVNSYYDLPQPTTIIRDRPGIERIWSGRGFLEDPDHNVAFQLGMELGVESVITYAVTELQNQDYLFVYLYDIPSNIVHEAETHTGDFTKEGSQAMVTMTRRAFAKFVKYRAKTEKSAQLSQF